MPLPVDGTPWPPKALKPLLHDMQESDAWYSGDVERLRGFYGAGSTGRTGFDTPNALGKVKFWQRRATETSGNRLQLHIPIAADIASTSADLLFSEAPKLTIPGAADGITQAGQAQDRLDELTDLGGTVNTLLESAEIASALGGVYLRAVWDDPDRLPHPTIDVVHADAAYPEWRWGRLVAVTFWTVLHDENGKVWRHLERHETGVILHGLYIGDRDKLGKRTALSAHPVTEALMLGSDREVSEDEVRVPLPTGVDLTVRYVPNVRPNRKHRGTQHGRSDFDGVYSLMDALDETFTSWMRDIRLGQARLLVDAQALESKGRGKGASFDVDREIFTPLEVDPTESGKMVEQVQFALRVQEHADTAMALVERIVSTAGYSPQSFGLNIEGRAESGSALRIREGKSLKTQGRKQRYWGPAIIDLSEMLLVIDRERYSGTAVPDRPQISWGDSLTDDPKEMAETLQLLKVAQAASVRTRVQLASPQLQGQALEDEVDAIMAEEGMAVADPTGFGA